MTDRLRSQVTDRLCSQVTDEEPNCRDLTYEAPADDLQALRERLDLERTAPLALVWRAARSCVEAAATAAAAAPVADDDVVAKAASSAVLDALTPPSEARTAIVALKISPQQVDCVWDALLWAAAVKGGGSGSVSQDAIAGMLEARVSHRCLASVCEQSKDDGRDCPANKVRAISSWHAFPVVVLCFSDLYISPKI